MRDSRLGIVLVLAAAEVFILGLMLRSLGFSGPVEAANFHTASFTPKTFSPIDAGLTPHVVIADAQSRVVVGVSTDNLVHVQDQSYFHGTIWGKKTLSQLLFTKTDDGVRIERPGDLAKEDIFSLGLWSDERISVEVPAGAHVQIVRSGGADISDLQADVVAHSNDGHITATRIRGAVDFTSDDGYLSLTDVVAPSVKLATKDGSLRFSGVDAGTLDARTDDGAVRGAHSEIADLRVGSGSIETSDGSVRIGLRNPDLTVAARTDDGRIRVNGVTQQHDDGDASSGTIRLGNGTGSLSVASHDGSISITTNGAQE